MEIGALITGFFSLFWIIVLVRVSQESGYRSTSYWAITHRKDTSLLIVILIIENILLTFLFLNLTI